jgi:hypothetical protein
VIQPTGRKHFFQSIFRLPVEWQILFGLLLLMVLRLISIIAIVLKQF